MRNANRHEARAMFERLGWDYNMRIAFGLSAPNLHGFICKALHEAGKDRDWVRQYIHEALGVTLDDAEKVVDKALWEDWLERNPHLHIEEPIWDRTYSDDDITHYFEWQSAER